MKKMKLIICLIFIALQLNGQPVKTYQGAFNSRLTTGKATYQYTENDNYERIYCGSFKYIADKNYMNITGGFKNNLKEGLWKFTVTNYPVFLAVQNGTASGSYKLGKMDGKWSYFSHILGTSQEYDQKINSKAIFSNGNLIGHFEYNETNKTSTSIFIKGKFNENGLFDSTWIIKAITDNGIVFENIRKYKNGVLYFQLFRNVGTGEILLKFDESASIENIDKCAKETVDFVPGPINNGKDLNEELYMIIAFWTNMRTMDSSPPINFQYEIQQGSIESKFYHEFQIIK